MTPAEIEEAVARNQMQEVLRLARYDLGGCANDIYSGVDYAVVERTLRKLGRHSRAWVRREAILSLGRLVYLTPKFDAPGIIYHIVLDGLRDPDPTIAQNADKAACCIAYMHGWKFPDRPRRRG